MAKDRESKTNNREKSRRSPALALLLVLLLAAAVFVMSDAPFIKSARDTLMQKLGYVSVDEADGGTGDAGGADDSGEGAGESSGASAGTGGGVDSLSENALPSFNGENYVKVNGGEPVFPDDVYERAGMVKDGSEWKKKGDLTPYEYYGSLDQLDRCTFAYGCLGEETMPEEGQERGDISSVHPSGWAKAQNWERCHLIAWALSAENANPQNLVTGTHYLNYDGMRPLEEEVEHYIWNTGNHVLYMSKPWYSGDELVARGVQMTAKSVEDGGKGISFNVYCFNVTPGAEIDYRTGVVTTEKQAAQDARVYIINTRSGVFHYPSCDGVKEMSQKNKKEVTATRSELTSQGYTPCGYCEP